MSAQRTGKIMVSFETGAMEWIDAWRSIFREGELDLWADRSLGASEDWADHFDRSLDEARAMVVLLSEKYLHSGYREHQRAWRKMSSASGGKKGVVVVLIERCEWEHFDELRQLATSGKLIDLSAGEPDRQRSGWIELGRELRRQYLPEAEPVKEAEGAAADHRRQWVPQSRIAESPLAEEARQILQAAAKLAQQRGRELLPLSTSCVLFALAESPDRTGGFIASHFRRRGDARVEEIAEKFFLYHVNLAAQERPRQTDLERIRVGQSMTPNVELLLQASADLARATTGSLEIGVRHLAAALLCAGDRDFGARKRIEELGVRQQELRQDLLEFVLKHHPDDDQENWHAMMAGRSPRMRKESPAPPSGSGEAERKKTAEAAAPKNLEPVDALPGVVLPGFDADFWRQAGREGADPNPDLLDIRDEVNALASLAAAWTVEPPLSIGLFGDWGSGKTFFMRKMMDRVNELAQAARDSGRKQKEIAFYKNIVQIEFNAWHYVEGNLWASLVEHIFSNLRLAGTGAADDPDGMSRLRTKLFDDLQIAEEIKRAAAARVAELESARDKAKARHQKVKEAHDDQARELAAVSARDIWAEIQHIPLNEEQKARLRDLGVGEQVMSSARELHESLEQLRAAGGRVRAHAAYFLNVLRQPKQFWLIAAGLVGVLLLGVGMTWFMRELGLREAGGAVSLSAQAIALVTGALAWLRGKSDKVNGALNLLEPVRQAIEKRIAAAESKRTEQVTSLEKTVELLGAECVEAKREVEKAEQRVAELEAKLAETTPAKQLARFIEDRAASDDYRRHLGILAVIRRDFEKLARLVASQREEERKGTEPLSDPTRINRIVLYIDDLDRCPAHKVVEVLQAIHLLLAFPLFVVVVGVDSRWISRSLETTYRRLLNPPAEGDPTDEAERLPGHGATPRDYLEKIFQIPFWLRPMQAQDCRRLIGGLTEDSIGGESTVAEGVETNVGEVSPNQQPASRRAASNAGPLDRVGEAAQKAAPVRPAADDPKPKDRADAITGPASVSNAKDEPQPARTARVELMPRALNLEPQEVTFMNELTDVLTRSPRSVKRFINCYRLIKAHLRPEQLAEFVGGQTGRGDYQPVMLLLAVLNGAPAVADKFLDRLTNPHPTFAFQELVSAMDLFNAMQPSDAWTSTKQLLNAHWNSRREQAPRRRWTVHQLIEELNAFGDRSNQQDRAVARKFFESFARRMESYTLKQVADELNSDSELAGRPEWGRVHRFIHHHADSDPARNDLRPVRRAAPFVARFSFRVAEMRAGTVRVEKRGETSAEPAR